MTSAMGDEQFARWLNEAREQNDQIRRLRGMETAAERVERLRSEAGLDGFHTTVQAEGRRQRQTETRRGTGLRIWHDFRSPGLRTDCTLLDGHTGICRRVRDSIENRPWPGSPTTPRYVIVVEATVGAR